MSINKEALALIKSFEGLMLKAYQDPVGIWTIGYGHTAAAGLPHPKAGMTVTARSAEALLIKDLQKYENAVKQAVKVPMSDNQFGALVSLCYNIGPGNFAKSTLVRKLNAGDVIGAANQFDVWVNADGKKLPGLVRRRAAEKALFRKASGVVVQRQVDDPGIPDSEVPQSKSGGILGAIMSFLMYLFKGGKK
jgi:lysozyme